MGYMEVTVIYRVQQTVKTISATYKTEHVSPVSLGGPESIVKQVIFVLITVLNEFYVSVCNN